MGGNYHFTRVPKVWRLLLIFISISYGCSFINNLPTQVSNQLSVSEQSDRIEIAGNLRATIQSDPCIEDMVLGLPEEEWRCTDSPSRTIPETTLVPTEKPEPSYQITVEENKYDIEVIQWDEAYQYVDQYMSVCGPVVDSYFAASTDGQPTFLNLGKEYPDPDRFTVLIWGRNLEGFPFNPDEYYYGKSICVAGKIVDYQGTFEIEARNPEQIEVE